MWPPAIPVNCHGRLQLVHELPEDVLVGFGLVHGVCHLLEHPEQDSLCCARQLTQLVMGKQQVHQLTDIVEPSENETVTVHVTDILASVIYLLISLTAFIKSNLSKASARPLNPATSRVHLTLMGQ